MRNLLEHAKRELELAGYDIEAPDKEVFDSDEDYGNACAKNAYEMLKVFSGAGHSGFSGGATLQLFNRLAEFKCLTPLNDNHDDWMDVSQCAANTYFQSKRQSSCFSDDGLKTYYDIDAEENKEYEFDDNGNKVSYRLKPREKLVKHPLEKTNKN